MKLTRWCVLIAAAVLVPSAASFAGFLNIGASITPLAGTCAWGDYDKDGRSRSRVAEPSHDEVRGRYTGTKRDVHRHRRVPPGVSNCALAWAIATTTVTSYLRDRRTEPADAAVTKLYIGSGHSPRHDRVVHRRV